MSYLYESALRRIAEALDVGGLEKPPVWLLGGSCALLLHNVPLDKPPSDIDLYADLEDAGLLHQALSCYSADEGPEEDYSGNCYSRRSRYVVDGMKVELVCGFRMGIPPFGYAADIHMLLNHAPVSRIDSLCLIRLMPLAHELLFNMLRGRMERCRAIAGRMHSSLQLHVPLLNELADRNELAPSCRAELYGLLRQPLETEFRKETAR
ncbi:hypothetical protein [Paenibacillus sp. FSL R7-0273]|uniref:hypothetical protein n=1 Tax=Paenibacillus sp. FSL R7-0273 TaxID=1536772 RepID=UPI00117E9CB4|nr:hypothetical protein [Paenibacillus sp. FSL R7-0273]